MNLVVLLQLSKKLTGPNLGNTKFRVTKLKLVKKIHKKNSLRVVSRETTSLKNCINAIIKYVFINEDKKGTTAVDSFFTPTLSALEDLHSQMRAAHYHF